MALSFQEQIKLIFVEIANIRRSHCARDRHREAVSPLEVPQHLSITRWTGIYIMRSNAGSRVGHYSGCSMFQTGHVRAYTCAAFGYSHTHSRVSRRLEKRLISAARRGYGAWNAASRRDSLKERLSTRRSLDNRINSFLVFLLEQRTIWCDISNISLFHYV